MTLALNIKTLNTTNSPHCINTIKSFVPPSSDGERAYFPFIFVRKVILCIIYLTISSVSIRNRDVWGKWRENFPDKMVWKLCARKMCTQSRIDRWVIRIVYRTGTKFIFLESSNQTTVYGVYRISFSSLSWM